MRSRAALVAARRRAGLTQEALAGRVGVDVSTVRRWERGSAVPYLRHRPRLADALRVPLPQLERILDGGTDPTPPPFTPAPFDGAVHFDPAAEPTAGARAAMEAFRIADRAGAGTDLFAEASAFAESYATRLIAAGGTTGPILVAVAGLTELVGWLAHDAGPGDALAARHFHRARDLAVAGGDLQLAAHAGASLAHLLASNGHGDSALDAADRAVFDLGSSARPGAVDAHVQAIRSRALALTGHSVEARAALRAAEDDLERDGVDASPWIHTFDVASLAAESARALAELGEHRAAIDAALVIDAHRAPASRAVALGAVRRAACLASLGCIDEAAELGSTVATAAWAARSVVIDGALVELEGILSGYQSTSGVRDFLEVRSRRN